ncbi:MULTISPECIES: bifunctional 2-keto-4-hydroxyglutarate aldolase/2-keto-3-deoxy-6-phosphogluconate aldolase [Desulfosporosinus]|uniref:KHG/KDPG aldolase n=1 Tax=Desulfosporosinus acididurans TaxID=476652 RepID=A0A0J1FQ40_9FIRM|nr:MULTISPECIES: bifunctional 2-keto-4-hydroxyglutarate aldolase/2-keto-3-deoxy-6-phosphogluconate aldolase [Desulfosporosinus]KLU65599.1 KHG/KDPG aldolase [Desulfosporosinus acididurans]
MKRIKMIEKILEAGVIAVIRAESKEKAIQIVEAVQKGGIRGIELTMTVPGAVDIIKELCKANTDHELIIGAGTVLDTETAAACIRAGADFIVSPSLNPEVLKLCNRYRVAVMPGVVTVRDAVEALEYGAEIIKVFPASLFGPGILSALKGPLPQANFMPTGGVTLDNIKDWVKAGAVAVGIGSELTKGAKTGDYELVEKTAAQFVGQFQKAIAEVRK